MNIRKPIYFGYARLRGRNFPKLYRKFLRDDQSGVSGDRTRPLLIQILTHCQQLVPYYSELMSKRENSFVRDPEVYLEQFPILTKDTIRSHFDQLKSVDIGQRRWYFETSGGSTGEPIRLIQDQVSDDRGTAIAMVYSKWAGLDFGESALYLWGSERDILKGSMGWKAYFSNMFTNTTFLNAFRMSVVKMYEFIDVLNTKRPKLIVAYAQAIYELATFAQREKLSVLPQSAIITSAGTLHPFMRETIEAVFQCKVYNRYGSREVGLIAGQCPAHTGLHVAPWGNYIEVVDDNGKPVPNGTDGNILITSLTNYVMPLIRYQIGDRGILSTTERCCCGRKGQILEKVLGRNVDVFRTKNGTLVDGEYFTHLLYYKDAIWKFQVIQTDYFNIIFKIAGPPWQRDQIELDEIVEKTKLVMGDDCTVTFQFVDDIPPSVSGKYRYTISEVQGK